MPKSSNTNIAARAGRWSAQHRKKAIVGWLVFVILAVFIGGSVGTQTLGDDDYEIGESGRADSVRSDHFPDKEDESVLVQSQNGARTDDAEFRQVVQTVVARLENTQNVRNVQSPYAEGSQGALSEDGKSALVTFDLPGEDADKKVEPSLETVAALDKQESQFRIEQFGGGSADKALSEAFEEDFQRAEVTSLPITLIILILAFGALLAAFVPLVLAITAVAAAIGLIGPISQIAPMEETVNSVVLLIGLAVGVDYSLFYLRREREERARGRSEEAALEAAAATSGRAVLVSGITVVAAMAGMYLGGAATFISFATGTILVVAISVIGSLTVLPAILSKLGDRVNKGRVPFLRPEKRTGEPRVWSALLNRVLKRPVVSLVAAGAVLVVLAIPVLHIHTADTGVEGLPRSIEAVQTYDRMQAAFPGEQFTADIVVEGRNLDQSEIQAAAQELRQVARGSDQFHEPVTVDMSRDGQVAVLEVPLAGSGTNEASMNALETLRDDVVPQIAPAVNSGEVVGVSGFTAGSADFNELMSERIWWVFGFVFLMAFLLLMVTFRSIVIPIKAIVLNIMSVAAAMGIVTYVFQDGHFESLLDFESTGAVAAWFPIMLFVILFGLSMDYHVFILSRIKEAFDRGAPSVYGSAVDHRSRTEEAVSHGIKSTAGVVSAAAIVMVGVFSIFATLSFIDMKQFGVGLAAAVLIDATLVRGVMLPAAMKLLGKWNWYLPSWLEWLPKGPAIEGSPEPVRREPLVRPGAEPRPAEA
jgi:uncharacterized membrane protein YdfJ with MMPL/SSD domain